VKVDCRKNVVRFLQRILEKISGRLWTLDEKGLTNHPFQSTFATKVYAQHHVNKSITALFTVFGIYVTVSNIPETL
jgi:hypothetical protein